MIEVGRLCVKIAGREAGRKCVIVDVIDNSYVLIDGQVRRKKCNVSHLEPLDKKMDIKKNASHSEIASEFKKLSIDIKETKKKEKTEKPKKKKRGREKEIVEETKKEKPKKKTVKKEKKKEAIESRLEK